ncbi:hypothetical protein [Nocardia nova]|uniref:hypothetical protein n=1 Tax=Nocardia nova TaxID=37330 RepID=UPI0033D01509
MQRNMYGADCFDCKRFVAPKQGFIYGAGHANIVVCEGCVYAAYGIQKGWLAQIESEPRRP